MDVSIVSGTYNRIAYLQNMVESIRQSVRFNLSYEVVLVDGGSIDGTIEWCKEQADIRLIEHGQLYGAVKAFNDGAFAAKGDYVILANDDIEFVGDSIWRAYLHMQLNPACGVGCFYQDRDRQDAPEESKWHVETMPVVVAGKQSAAYYGQVCIVPRWLGDKVSWWCDGEQYKMIGSERRDPNIKPLHTYAGDNELSARVYELGYQVLPVEGAKIHDTVALDELRKLNNIQGGKDPKAVRGHHPDSWSWGRKWRNPQTELVGPILKDAPMALNPLSESPRILYLPIYEQGWAIQKEQKRGLREALQEAGIVQEYDYVSRFHEAGKETMLTEIRSALINLRPTLVLSQLHNDANINPFDLADFRRLAPRTRFVNWNGDYWPDNLLSSQGIALARSFDLMTSVNLDAVEKYLAMGINARFWQIGWEPDGRVDQPAHYNDVVFLASGYSQARQELGRWLKAMRGFRFGLWGSGWPDGWSNGQNLYNFKEAAEIYKGAKLALGDSQWPQSGFVSNRVMQILAAGGCALCHQWFRGMENLGLVDGQTCIVWQDKGELEIKIRHYLNQESERKRIAEAGERLALERHSFQARVKELFAMLDPKGISEPMEDWRY
jgi:glycosyltransferase involved in cell wall biosynthesis